MKKRIFSFSVMLFSSQSFGLQEPNWALSAIHAQSTVQSFVKKKTVTVAVIDTGADLEHPALANQIWQNPGETGPDSQGHDKATNNIDDDQNGFIDDVNGWDFVSQQKTIADNHGHGTHIAGIVHAVSPDTKLMILKYFDPRIKGTDTLQTLIQAIHYAIQNKADIINFSGGGSAFSLLEKAAIHQAELAGILVIAASGNESQNADQHPFYPASYGLQNILSVTAHNAQNWTLQSSNYGTRNVQISAPGQDIMSLLPGGGQGEMTGTSQATAFVTGAAALLRAQRPDLSPAQVVSHIKGSSRFETSLTGFSASSGRLDVNRVLRLQDRSRTLAGYKVVSSLGTTRKN